MTSFFMIGYVTLNKNLKTRTKQSGSDDVCFQRIVIAAAASEPEANEPEANERGSSLISRGLLYRGLQSLFLTKRKELW